jgi:hypothetical protein
MLHHKAEIDNDDNLKASYLEICKSYHEIDGFRGKLLGFLPLATGGGIFLLLGIKDVSYEYLLPIGLFGFFATLGLFLFEAGGIQECYALIKVGKALEHDLRLTRQPERPKYGPPPQPIRLGQFHMHPKSLSWVYGSGPASIVVYATVMSGWNYLATSKICPSDAKVLGWVLIVVTIVAMLPALRAIILDALGVNNVGELKNRLVLQWRKIRHKKLDKSASS